MDEILKLIETLSSITKEKEIFKVGNKIGKMVTDKYDAKVITREQIENIIKPKLKEVSDKHLYYRIELGEDITEEQLN